VPGAPPGLEHDPSNFDTVALWLERGESFAIVTYGSSSCPPVATSLSGEGNDRIAVNFAPSKNEQCTADMAPTTHEFKLPDGVDRTPVTITVSYEESSKTDILTLE